MRQSRTSMLAFAAVFYALFVAGALIWASVRGDVRDILGPERDPGAVALSALWGALLGLAGVGLSRVAERRFDWAKELSRALSEVLGRVGLLEATVLSVLSAVGEELLFRGAIQQSWGVWVASVLFALVHLGPGRRFLFWPVTALVFGLALGWLFILTGSLLGPIVAHFTINFFNLSYLSEGE